MLIEVDFSEIDPEVYEIPEEVVLKLTKRALDLVTPDSIDRFLDQPLKFLLWMELLCARGSYVVNNSFEEYLIQYCDKVCEPIRKSNPVKAKGKNQKPVKISLKSLPRCGGGKNVTG